MQLAKKYLTISLPVIIVVFSQTVIYWSDRVILQFLTNSVEVGFYVAAFGFSNFIRLIQNSAGTIFFPTFTKHLSNGDYFKINNLIKKYERFNFIFVMPFIMFSAIYSKTIIKIVLGSKYLPTIPIFSIIMIAVFIPVLSLPYGNIIFGKGMFKLSAKISFIAMIYFVIIIFILSNPVIFDLKGVGVALGLLSTNLFLWIMFVVFSKKYIPEIKVLKDLKIGIIGIIYSVLFFFLFKILANGFIVKTVMALIFFIGYWGVLFLFKKISKKDLFFIREILNINKMKKYVKDEISIKE
jgi:O-antigen/teichoic acid export membrane protein